MRFAKALVPLACTLFVAAGARAQILPPFVSYTAKFTCGTESTKEADDVVSGVYASSINIHNPQAKASVTFIKKIVVANREDTTPGRIVVLREVLKPDQADRVDCIFIKSKLGLSPMAYVEGLIVLEVPGANRELFLDVIGKYTARALTGNVTTQSVVPIVGKTIND
jgi:hypothetical protein